MILPITITGTFSRLPTASMNSRSFSRISIASFSWNSAPHSSFTDIVGSPTTRLRMSSSAPFGAEISFSTFPFPPAPWSWIDTIGFASRRSIAARITRFILFSISASPRCTASKSSAACDASCMRLDAAPPPRPMRYAGPPTFTTSMSFSGLPLCRWRSSSWPTPPENMMGFTYSRRSPFGMRCAKERVKPVITGSPNLLP